MTTCSNKKIGNDFENLLCRWYADRGYWVHFLAPDARGAQPFDIIAVKDGTAEAVDCKTASRHFISYDRLEDNQILAFEKWIACGNFMPYIAVLYAGNLYMITYERLKNERRIDLRKEVAAWHIVVY